MESAEDQLIVQLIEKMHAKVPADKRLTSGVASQLLSTKFKSQLPSTDIASKKDLIEKTLARLQTPASAGIEPDSDEETEESSEADDSEGESTDDEDNGDDEDEEDLFDDSDDDDQHSDGEEPPRQKQRVEAGELSQLSPSQRLEGMLICLSKLHFRVPQRQGTEETDEHYIAECLVPFFRSKGLDPDRFTADDVRRYKIRQELKALEADGADVNLDRSQRRGRINASAASEPAPARPTFLDDEE
jgi:hypothetical protein